MAERERVQKFDAAFLARRMEEHRQWQEREAERLAQEIAEEVLAVTEPPHFA